MGIPDCVGRRGSLAGDTQRDAGCRRTSARTRACRRGVSPSGVARSLRPRRRTLSRRPIDSCRRPPSRQLRNSGRNQLADVFGAGARAVVERRAGDRRARLGSRCGAGGTRSGGRLLRRLRRVRAGVVCLDGRRHRARRRIRSPWCGRGPGRRRAHHEADPGSHRDRRRRCVAPRRRGLLDRRARLVGHCPASVVGPGP